MITRPLLPDIAHVPEMGVPWPECKGSANRPARVAPPYQSQPMNSRIRSIVVPLAIAASLACGKPLLDAVVEGKAYVYESIRTGVWVGEAAAVLGTPARLPVEAVRVEPVQP